MRNKGVGMHWREDGKLRGGEGLLVRRSLLRFRGRVMVGLS
jgi:hypothetical protein